MKRKRKHKTMSETKIEKLPEPEIVQKETNEEGRVDIQRNPEDGKLHIFIKNPLVASIVRKMVPGNYNREEVDAVYYPLLAPVLKDGKPDPAAAHAFVTRPALGKATTQFARTTQFSFLEKPSTILFSNPDLLEKGYTLVVNIDSPVPIDQLKRWAKYIMDGWNEIITNAKPFKMSWVMEKIA